MIFVLILIGSGLLGFGTTPLLVVTAQDLVPHSSAAAAGIVFGVGAGLTGLLYLAIGALQSRIGALPTITIAYSAPFAAALMLSSMQRLRAVPQGVGATALNLVCACFSAASGATVGCDCSSDAGPCPMHKTA